MTQISPLRILTVSAPLVQGGVISFVVAGPSGATAVAQLLSNTNKPLCDPIAYPTLGGGWNAQFMMTIPVKSSQPLHFKIEVTATLGGETWACSRSVVAEPAEIPIAVNGVQHRITTLLNSCRAGDELVFTLRTLPNVELIINLVPTKNLLLPPSVVYSNSGKTGEVIVKLKTPAGDPFGEPADMLPFLYDQHYRLVITAIQKSATGVIEQPVVVGRQYHVPQLPDLDSALRMWMSGIVQPGFIADTSQVQADYTLWMIGPAKFQPGLDYLISLATDKPGIYPVTVSMSGRKTTQIETDVAVCYRGPQYFTGAEVTIAIPEYIKQLTVKIGNCTLTPQLL